MAELSAEVKVLAEQIAELWQQTPRFLRQYHQIGMLLAATKSSYGAREVETVAKYLAGLGIKGAGASTLHKVRKLSEVLSQDQVEAMQRQGVSWRAAARLTSRNLSKRRRDALIAKILSGQIKPDELGKMLESSQSDDAINNTRSVEAAYKRALQAIELLMRVHGASSDAGLKEVKQLAADRLSALRRSLRR